MGMPRGQKIDLEALQARRLEAAGLLGEGLSQAEVARRLKVSRESVRRWAGQSHSRLRALRPMGRKSKLTELAREGLRTALLAGPKAAGFATELWTLPRVRQLITQRTGLRFSTVHVWRILGQLGFSPQRPAGRARERDEAKIAAWKSQDWPRIKKKLSGSGGRSSSSTKVD
jgi:transposase